MANPWQAAAPAPAAPAAPAVAPVATPPPVAGGAPRPGNPFTRCLARIPKERILLMMRILNILNAALIVMSFIFAFSLIDGNVTRFFFVVYIGFFGLLLFSFELRWKKVEGRIRRMFGFMFTYWGRTLFLLFVGLINFGMLDGEGDPAHDVVLAVGILTTANALFSCLVLCSHPGFRKTAATAHPEMSSEEAVVAYLQQHPELAAAAAQGMVTESAAAPPVAPDFGAGTAAQAGHRNTSFAAVEAGQGGYVPPAAAAAPAKKDKKKKKKKKGKKDAATEDNPFGDTGGVAASAPPPVPERAPAAAAPPPVPVRDTAAETGGAGEDNPFGGDNPFQD